MLNLLSKHYCFKSCAGEYAAFLNSAQERGFSIISLEEYYTKLLRGTLEPLTMALRHDVDGPDIKGNEMFFNIEKKYGARATYYFRLLFINNYNSFIEELIKNGFSVGYHFEEPATVAKRRRLKSRQAVFAYRPEIADLFTKNFEHFKLSVRAPITSICSHGDWINRKLGFRNFEFMDGTIFKRCGIEFEAYNEALIKSFSLYLSDTAVKPADFAGRLKEMDGSLNAFPQSIMVLTHECNWHPNFLSNTYQILARLAEEVQYSLFTV